jgi:hypothetical protein
MISVESSYVLENVSIGRRCTLDVIDNTAWSISPALELCALFQLLSPCITIIMIYPAFPVLFQQHHLSLCHDLVHRPPSLTSNRLLS